MKTTGKKTYTTKQLINKIKNDFGNLYTLDDIKRHLEYDGISYFYQNRIVYCNFGIYSEV